MLLQNALLSAIRYETSTDESNEYTYTMADIFMKVI